MQVNDLFLAKMSTLQSCQCPYDCHGTYVSCLLYMLSPLLYMSKFIVLATLLTIIVTFLILLYTPPRHLF